MGQTLMLFSVNLNETVPVINYDTMKMHGGSGGISVCILNIGAGYSTANTK
jgi:hypothetical protein